MADDGEAELNLPREDATERDRPGENGQDSPGATASGTSVDQGRPIPVIKDPRSPGMEVTMDVDGPGTNGDRMKVLAPTLPPFLQVRQGIMPVDAVGFWGFRGPGGQLTGKKAQVDSHVFTDPQDKDVISDRRDLHWSMEIVLMDTLARLQRDLNDMRAKTRYLRSPGVRNALRPTGHVTFTSTKVPRFAGATSLEQYHQVFDAIVLSNGWDDATAALQLLSHLEGDALNVTVSCGAGAAGRLPATI